MFEVTLVVIGGVFVVAYGWSWCRVWRDGIGDQEGDVTGFGGG